MMTLTLKLFYHKRILRGFWVLFVGYSLFLMGCTAEKSVVLPSVQATAPIPTLISTPSIPVPVTFTPVGLLDAEDVEPTLAATVSVTAVSTLTPLPINNQVEPDDLVAIVEREDAADIIPNFLSITPPLEAVALDAPPDKIPCNEQGMLLRSQFPSDVGGLLREYHAYLPPCYGVDGRSYPTLYLFHGSIQTDTHWIDLGIIEHIELGIQEERYPPFIVIMPFNDEIGNTTSGNDHSIEGITLNALIPYVDTQFCSWNEAAGRSIGGISRGGYWALEIAFRHTELFTAVSGHSSHLRFETDRAEYNPLATYADADLSEMRIWLDWGVDDFLHVGQEQLRDSLREIGANLDVYVNGGGHNDGYWLLHIRDYLDWHTAVWPTERDEYPLCR